MQTWQPATRRTWYRLATIMLLLALAGGLVVTASDPAGATADMQLGSLDVAGVNQTVSGNVSDVQLTATLDYEHDVPDATRRIVRLKVGPSKDNLELLAYTQTRDPSGAASGTVTLAGSLFEHPSFDADTFNPALASTNSQTVVVQAVIEVQRAGGDAVTHTVTDTATITLTDDADLTATIGGDGSLSVSTAP